MIYTFTPSIESEDPCRIMVDETDHSLYVHAFDAGKLAGVAPEILTRKLGANILVKPEGGFIKLTNLPTQMGKLTVEDLRHVGQGAVSRLKFVQQQFPKEIEQAYCSENGILAFSDMLPVSLRNMGRDTKLAVEGRILHRTLEVNEPYMQWIRTEIEAIEEHFEDGIDHCDDIEVTGERFHLLSVEMAKHIVMRDKGKKGHGVRQYFIAMEAGIKDKAAKTSVRDLAPILQELAKVRQEAWAANNRMAETLEAHRKENLETLVQFKSDILTALQALSKRPTKFRFKTTVTAGTDPESWSFREAAAIVGISTRIDSKVPSITRLLRDLGFIISDGQGHWGVVAGYSAMFITQGAANPRLTQVGIDQVKEFLKV